MQFIPSLAYNLLSVEQLMYSRYRILFNDNSCRVEDRKTGHTIVNVQMAQNKLFPLYAFNTALAVSKIGESNYGICIMSIYMKMGWNCWVRKIWLIGYPRLNLLGFMNDVF